MITVIVSALNAGKKIGPIIRIAKNAFSLTEPVTTNSGCCFSFSSNNKH